MSTRRREIMPIRGCRIEVEGERRFRQLANPMNSAFYDGCRTIDWRSLRESNPCFSLERAASVGSTQAQRSGASEEPIGSLDLLSPLRVLPIDHAWRRARYLAESRRRADSGFAPAASDRRGEHCALSGGRGRAALTNGVWFATRPKSS